MLIERGLGGGFERGKAIGVEMRHGVGHKLCDLLLAGTARRQALSRNTHPGQRRGELERSGGATMLCENHEVNDTPNDARPAMVIAPTAMNTLIRGKALPRKGYDSSETWGCSPLSGVSERLVDSGTRISRPLQGNLFKIQWPFILWKTLLARSAHRFAALGAELIEEFFRGGVGLFGDELCEMKLADAGAALLAWRNLAEVASALADASSPWFADTEDRGDLGGSHASVVGSKNTVAEIL